MLITSSERVAARKIYERKTGRNIDLLSTHERLMALDQIREIALSIKRGKA